MVKVKGSGVAVDMVGIEKIGRAAVAKPIGIKLLVVQGVAQVVANDAEAVAGEDDVAGSIGDGGFGAIVNGIGNESIVLIKKCSVAGSGNFFLYLIEDEGIVGREFGLRGLRRRCSAEGVLEEQPTKKIGN